MTGRKPKPIAIRILQGNPGHRPIPKTPEPAGGIPSCPSFLDRDARKEWRRIAPLLADMNLLTSVDRAALAAYCQAYSRWQAAEEAIASLGMTFTTKEGYVAQRPEVTIAKQSLQIVKSFASEFGLTPSSRARLQVPESKGTDPLEDALCG